MGARHHRGAGSVSPRPSSPSATRSLKPRPWTGRQLRSPRGTVRVHPRGMLKHFSVTLGAARGIGRNPVLHQRRCHSFARSSARAARARRGREHGGMVSGYKECLHQTGASRVGTFGRARASTTRRPRPLADRGPAGEHSPPGSRDQRLVCSGEGERIGRQNGRSACRRSGVGPRARDGGDHQARRASACRKAV